jgi:hypothetical protein
MTACTGQPFVALFGQQAVFLWPETVFKITSNVRAEADFAPGKNSGEIHHFQI